MSGEKSAFDCALDNLEKVDAFISKSSQYAKIEKEKKNNKKFI